MARRTYLQDYPVMNLWEQLGWSTKIILIVLLGMILLLCLLIMIRLGFTPIPRNLLSSEGGIPIFPTPASGAPGLTANMTLNVFSGPGINFEVINQLKEGSSAQIAGVSPDRKWWIILAPTFDGGFGWVEASSVDTNNAESVPVIEYSNNNQIGQELHSQKMYISANKDVKILNGPGLEYSNLGILLSGQTAEVIGRSNDGTWWIVSVPIVENGLGWVPSDSVTLTNSIEVPAVETTDVTQAENVPLEDLPVVEALANVNIRNGPDIQFETIGLLRFGDVAEVVGISNDRSWWAIKIPFANSGQGWVFADYVEPRNTENVLVIEQQQISGQTDVPTPAIGMPELTAITRVNIRNGPGEEFQILGMLEAEQKAEIAGVTPDGMWWAIKLPSVQNGLGWVSARFSLAKNVESIEVIK